MEQKKDNKLVPGAGFSSDSYLRPESSRLAIVHPQRRLPTNSCEQNASGNMQAQPGPAQLGFHSNVTGINTPAASLQAPTNFATIKSAPAQVPSAETATLTSMIWKGILEWAEKSKTSETKQTHQIPCTVTSNVKNGEAEVKSETWPPKLIMQLMPKILIGNIGQAYLKNSKPVFFFPEQSKELEPLTKVMSNGFAGCVHFTATSRCNIKVLLLIYTAEKQSFLGFIPNNQQAFVDRLRIVIKKQKILHAKLNPVPVPLKPVASSIASSVPGCSAVPVNSVNTGLSQTNTVNMGGNQLTQNVTTNNGILPTASTSASQSQLNRQASAMPLISVGPQMNFNASGSLTGQHQQMTMTRQQNLLKIQQLQQTLEAARQQEAQFKAMEMQQKLKPAQVWFKQMELRLSAETRPQGNTEDNKRRKFDSGFIPETASTSTARVGEPIQPSCSYMSSSLPTASTAVSSSSGSNTSQKEIRKVTLPNASSHKTMKQEPFSIDLTNDVADRTRMNKYVKNESPSDEEISLAVQDIIAILSDE